MNQSILKTLSEEEGPFSLEGIFTPGEEGRKFFEEAKVLVIGAGGLGCELLKSLALIGFKHIETIDMDIIDKSNLNRQFLFRDKDIGREKSIVAAEAVQNRIKGVKVIGHFGRIEQFPDSFYKGFDVVIGGLDSIKARLWINEKLVQIARDSNNEIQIPYIDGGTEEWAGHVKVIWPNKSSCMKCQEDLFHRATVFQSCTLASNPRLPEHCVIWAKLIQWEKERPNESVDGDNDEHIRWIMDRAIQHAKEFNIDCVIDEKFTKGVVKNIVPAIASTQAIIASMCATEAFKIVTASAPELNNNFNYFGNIRGTGVNGLKFIHERNKNCAVCSRKLIKLEFCGDDTLEALIHKIEQKFECEIAILLHGKDCIFSFFDNSMLNKKVSSFACSKYSITSGYCLATSATSRSSSPISDVTLFDID